MIITPLLLSLLGRSCRSNIQSRSCWLEELSFHGSSKIKADNHRQPWAMVLDDVKVDLLINSCLFIDWCQVSDEEGALGSEGDFHSDKVQWIITTMLVGWMALTMFWHPCVGLTLLLQWIRWVAQAPGSLVLGSKLGCILAQNRPHLVVPPRGAGKERRHCCLCTDSNRSAPNWKVERWTLTVEFWWGMLSLAIPKTWLAVVTRGIVPDAPFM